jgi:hypothetical protein
MLLQSAYPVGLLKKKKKKNTNPVGIFKELRDLKIEGRINLKGRPRSVNLSRPFWAILRPIIELNEEKLRIYGLHLTTHFPSGRGTMSDREYLFMILFQGWMGQ